MPASPHAPRWTLRGFTDAALAVGLLGALGLCLLTTIAFAGQLHWLLEITTHFRPHYGILLLICAATYAFARRFRWAGVFALFAALNFIVLAPRFIPHDRAPANATQLKLLLANVQSGNTHHAAVLELIAREQPDVVALLEVNATWLTAMAPLAESYPHIVRVARSDNFGIAVFSRLPLSDTQTLYFSPAEVPSIRATLTLASGKSILLLATHPLPPGGAEGQYLRDKQLSKIASWSATAAHPAIVLGDLNCTPWSPAFRSLLADGELIDTGYGLAPTWPVTPWYLRIPLDHCLTTRTLSVVNHHVGPDIGSDHFPIIVTLALP
ncbi:endonuclease/exonuclease/phosphatase family protein [Rariglobus hedericola]|uniref:Endonuclease/exonuclease/phosphatase domain-containing protein n=1 Tax=Rariglobus hedericola TaxID=2597822 RepID=A0A556QJR4_9BACT|nr:endonuclease/exonuclease/phosphatase family protein [Rariglobus hedericola]TSJ76895.1 hypothetical protein FPL22_12315 [Rariglobus hedericola]